MLKIKKSLLIALMLLSSAPLLSMEDDGSDSDTNNNNNKRKQEDAFGKKNNSSNKKVFSDDKYEMQKEFMKAIKEHHLEKIKDFIKKGVDLNKEIYTHPGDATPLIHFFNRKSKNKESEKKKELEIVKLLIESGADVNFKNALILAIRKGFFHVVPLLLEKGANLKCGNGDSPLTTLINANPSNSLELVKLFISKGADVNGVQIGQFTPLMAACKVGNFDVVNLLIQSGARINEKVNYPSNSPIYSNGMLTSGSNGQTALMLACRFGNVDIIKLLLESGAKVNDRDIEGGSPALFYVLETKGNKSEIIKLLIENGADINSRDNGFSTALILASTLGYSDVVQLLIELGADINITNKKSYYIPVESKSMQSSSSLGVPGLITYSGTYMPKKNLSAFEVASLFKHVEIVKLFKNTVNNWKQEVYNSIKNKDNTNFKKYIQKIGSICFKDENGNNLLHIAAKLGNLDIFKFVLINNFKQYKPADKSFLLKQLNNKNQSVLDVAFDAGNFEIIEVVLGLSSKFNVDIKDENLVEKQFEVDIKECIENLLLNVDNESKRSLILRLSYNKDMKKIFEKYSKAGFTSENKTEIVNRQLQERKLELQKLYLLEKKAISIQDLMLHLKTNEEKIKTLLPTGKNIGFIKEFFIKYSSCLDHQKKAALIELFKIYNICQECSLIVQIKTQEEANNNLEKFKEFLFYRFKYSEILINILEILKPLMNEKLN